MFWKTPDPKLPKTDPPPFDLVEQLHDAQKQIKQLQDLLQRERGLKELYSQKLAEAERKLADIFDIVDG